jgi:hypothetical protein
LFKESQKKNNDKIQTEYKKADEEKDDREKREILKLKKQVHELRLEFYSGVARGEGGSYVFMPTAPLPPSTS